MTIMGQTGHARPSLYSPFGTGPDQVIFLKKNKKVVGLTGQRDVLGKARHPWA